MNLLLELLIFVCATDPWIFALVSLGHSFDFVPHFTLRFPLRISSLALPGFGWGGKGNKVRGSIFSPFHTLWCQEGLEAARGTHSHAISCSSPALPFRGRRRHREEALEVHGHVSGTPAPAEPLWYLETVPGSSRRVLWGVFFKMFVFKILIKERQGVQLLADCCAGLLKDQHVWTHGLFHFWCWEFFIFLLRFMVCFISGFAGLQRAVKSPNPCT